MKAAFVLALPALALAAATPQIKERQIPGLPGLPGFPGLPNTTPLFSILDPECLGELAGLAKCLKKPLDGNTSIGDLVGCPVSVIASVVACVKVPEIPEVPTPELPVPELPVPELPVPELPVPEIPGTQ